MPESFVNQATGRCSVDGSKYWFNCNPDGPEHWFKKNWIDKADEKVDEIRTNDSVIRAVDKAEEVTGKATEALFSGLKKIFNKGDE